MLGIHSWKSQGCGRSDNQPGPIEGHWPMDTPSTLSNTSAEAPIKFTEHSRHWVISTPLRKTCPKEFPMSLDWHDDEKEEEQVKGEDKDKGNDQKTPQTNPKFFAMTTLLQSHPNPLSLNVLVKYPV